MDANKQRGEGVSLIVVGCGGSDVTSWRGQRLLQAVAMVSQEVPGTKGLLVTHIGQGGCW